MKKYFWKIFGCAMNYADAERVARVFEKLDFERTENLDDADLVLIFSCVVRQKSENKIFGELEKLKKWKSAKLSRQIGLTGCAIRRTSNHESAKKDAFLRRAEILDFVWQIKDSIKLGEFLGVEKFKSCENFLEIDPVRQNRRRVFVPISTGCDNFCSYCVVPFARGREVSRSEKKILTECEKAVKNEAREITLLGQNVNSFQKKQGAFAQLLAKVAAIPSLKRLRFISSHPKDFDESVIEVMAANKNIERHLHLPAQHGDNEILRKMNRNYSVEKYLDLLQKFREKLPTASITTDLIVGFPGETEENFENLLSFYQKANFDFAFFSQYSPRPETAAATFENQIPAILKKERFRKLNDLVITITTQKLMKMKNKTLDVLVEKCRNGFCEGRSSEFYLVKFEGDEKLVGEIAKVKVIQPREVELFGEIIYF